MARQIAAVISGIVFAYLLIAMGGYLLYLHYGCDDYSAGVVARYVGGPIVALLTGALVGVIAKRRPALLAALSLLPSSFGVLQAAQRRLDASHFLFMALIEVMTLLIGAGAAWLVFRMRTRSGDAAISVAG